MYTATSTRCPMFLLALSLVHSSKVGSQDVVAESYVWLARPHFLLQVCQAQFVLSRQGLRAGVTGAICPVMMNSWQVCQVQFILSR